MPRLVLLTTSPRVAPGILSAQAWEALRGGPVFCRDQDHAQRPALTAAGVDTEAVDPTWSAMAIARLLVDVAHRDGTVVWLAAPDGDEDIGRALGSVLTRAADGGEVELELLPGSWDLPGARLLDAVAVMDRLRSPGGCPWDAEQTHASLARYLVEETYEAYQAIEDGDLLALREELGDVLLQVLFHARIASERGDAGWTVDDVAAGLVDKLVRRHPHVFADVEAGSASDLDERWDAIKAAERGADVSAVAGVPLAQPALTLAEVLQRKASRIGMSPDDVAPGLAAAESPAAAIGAAASSYDESPSPGSAGRLLWTVVAALREHGIEPEPALRAVAREFRDEVMQWESTRPDRAG